MRNLFILRGCPASGKSTWISKNNLTNWTISSDNVRLLFQSPIVDINGKPSISQANDKRVWNFIYQNIEEKMQRGETIFVDATHYNNKSLTKYKDLIKKYKYRAYIVDFMSDDLTLDELYERNNDRERLRQVPNEVIERMYNTLKSNEAPSSSFKVITPDKVIDMLYEHKYLIYDFDIYNKIYIIGDIHGCYQPLEDFFNENPYNEKNYYIFVGDLLDRGIQNKETIEFVYELLKKSVDNEARNVLILQGNHENWLVNYARGEGKLSDEFQTNTIPQIKDVPMNKIKYITDRLGQLAYFYRNGKVFFVSHGGLSTLPNGLTSTNELIKGTGGYGELSVVYNSWIENSPSNWVMVHGHRNLSMYPIDAVKGRIYNLNDEVENGGYLRILEIDNIGNINGLYIKNDIYEERQRRTTTEKVFTSDNKIIEDLNNSKLINKKVLKDGIVSFNFSRDAFTDKKWNDLTCKARGLFVDSQTSKIVCRSYSKFFNYEEIPETRPESLRKTLQYPVYAYRKENGFLGLVSYDKRNDKLFIASKSTNEGIYANYVREEWERLPESTKELLTAFLKGNNCTLVFECIKVKEDPHMIKYMNNELYLLDVIENDFEFHKMPYKELCDFAELYGLEHKELEYIFESGDAIDKFFDRVIMNPNDYLIEGWVFEDSKGFMFKYKTPFYSFWKQMRSIKDRIATYKELNGYYTDKQQRIISFMKENYTPEQLSNMSIIEVREAYERK